jgi:hypothetical protein
MPRFVVRVAEHPHAYLASARAGIFRGGWVASLAAPGQEEGPPAPPPPLGGADDLDVGCGTTVDEALEDLAVWLRILAQRVPPLRSDRRPIAHAIRRAEEAGRDELLAELRELVVDALPVHAGEPAP